MKIVKRIICAAVATLMLLPVTACKKGGAQNMTQLDEIAELNSALVAPFKLGDSQKTLEKGGYEFARGVEHHYCGLHCQTSQDVYYFVGTYDMHYGEPDPNQELYVVGFRITPQGKTIQKNDDGTTTPVYTTSRSVFGIKVGSMIEDAKKILTDNGYTCIHEEAKEMTGLPKSREVSFRKGAIVFSMAVERTDDISQIAVWVPYHDDQIEALNNQSNLPAKLGLIYSVLENAEFSYAGKNRTSRKYTTPDGCVAIMRGFPDYVDMNMTAEISFVSDKYNVLGVTVGMTEAEAVSMLESKGCKADAGGVYTYNSVVAIKLVVENGVVTRVAACLRPSTNLSNIDTGETEAGKEDSSSVSLETTPAPASRETIGGKH